MNGLNVLGLKINIFGNQHCGDESLAKELSQLLNLPIVNLKSIMWNYEVNPPVRHGARIITDNIKNMQNKLPNRIVHGPYGSHQHIILEDTDFLIFINLTTKEYEQQFKQRKNWNQSELNYSMTYFQEKRYSTTDNKIEIYSQGYHSKLFNEFKGKKVEFNTLKDINDFIEHYRNLIEKDKQSTSDIIESLF